MELRAKLPPSKANAATEATTVRTPLRTPDGGYLPMLYTHEGEEVCMADPRVIIQSAEALLSYRFRRGVRILRKRLDHSRYRAGNAARLPLTMQGNRRKEQQQQKWKSPHESRGLANECGRQGSCWWRSGK